jgi:hypothetical protein
VAISPNPQLAAIMSSAVYSMWFIFAGFFIPYAAMPKWWSWVSGALVGAVLCTVWGWVCALCGAGLGEGSAGWHQHSCTCTRAWCLRTHTLRSAAHCYWLCCVVLCAVLLAQPTELHDLWSHHKVRVMHQLWVLCQWTFSCSSVQLAASPAALSCGYRYCPLLTKTAVRPSGLFSADVYGVSELSSVVTCCSQLGDVTDTLTVAPGETSTVQNLLKGTSTGCMATLAGFLCRMKQPGSSHIDIACRSCACAHLK